MGDDQASRGDGTCNKITGGTFYAPVTFAHDVTMQGIAPAPEARNTPTFQYGQQPYPSGT